MANGYIGKISAVVTANTSDLSRRLAAARGDFDTFANRLGRSIEASSRSASASIDRIFTRYQRLEQGFRSALEINLRTDDQINKIRQLVSAAEQINKPLASAAGSFEKLSLGVQGAFLPALRASQGQVELLNRKINDTGSVSSRAFGIVEQSVSRTAAAIQRLGEAQRLVSSGPRADSLAFVDPRAAQALQASAAIRQQASQLPASALADGRVARQVGNLSAVDNRIAEARARIESIQARPRVDATELAAARKELDRLLAGAERIRAGIQIRLDAQKAIADANTLKQTLDAIRSQQQFSATGRFQNIEQAKESLQEAIALQDKLTAGQRAAIQPATSAAIDAVESAGTTGNFDAAQDAIDKIRQSAQAGISLNLQSEAAQKAANDLAATIGRLKENADFVITGRPQNFDQVQAELNRIIGTLDKLDPAGRGGLSADITAVIDLIGQEDIAGATAALDALRKKAGDTIEIKVEADAATNRITALEATWNKALSGIPASAKEIDSEFQSLAGRISQLDIADRVRLDKLVQDFQASVKAGDPLITQYQKLLALANAVGKVDGKGLARTGDIARGAFGNSTLAIQQATFALDDFFSVTGGLDQRIRAAGNNLSQLGFILGGTEGLILGVAASITAQLLVSFSRWANDTAAAEARTKALNEGLSRQKSSVESLAQAYRSLAEEIERAGAGDQRRRGVETRQRADEIRRLSQEARREDVAAFSPEVARIRAERGALEKSLESETDVEKRLRLQAEIDRNRRREELAVARGIPLPSREEVGRGLVEAEQARVRELEVRLRRAELRADLGGEAPPGEDVASLRGRLAAARGDLDRRAADGAGPTGQQQLQQLRDVQAALESQRAERQRLRDRGESIRIDELDNAIDDVIVQIRRLETALSPEVQGVARAVNADSLAIASGLESIQSRAAELGSAGIEREAAAIGQSLAAANRRLAQATSVEEAEAIAGQVRALEQQKSALESLTSTVEVFAATIDRISTQLANTVAQEARSAADQARRDANAADANAGRGGGGVAALDDLEFANRQRARAEQSARDAEDRAAEVNRENARVRDDFERDARRGGLGAETQRLIEERDAIDAILREDSAASDQQRQEARRRRDEIDRQLDRQFEDSPAGREAAARADRADREQAARAQREDDIRRGRELSRSPAEQAGRQLADDLRALEAARQDAREGDVFGRRGGQIDAEFAADRQRIIEESFRSTAPAIFALADSVANAVLQGPSRAALEATDVSSVEGARELNRLLRGDDAARDQNLVELQKQSQALDELVRIAREGGADIAN